MAYLFSSKSSRPLIQPVHRIYNEIPTYHTPGLPVVDPHSYTYRCPQIHNNDRDGDTFIYAKPRMRVRPLIGTKSGLLG